MEGTTGARSVLGVDVGGTKIAAALVTEGSGSGTVITTPTPTGAPSAVLAAIEAVAAELIADAEAAPVAVGVGLPGLVNSETGVIVSAANLPWANTQVAAPLAANLRLPVFIGNDANAAALGEKWFGKASGVDRFVCITIGTGIGSGVVIGGALLPDNRERSVELGHIIVKVDGPPCGCGSRGCLETLAAGPSIARRMRERYGREMSSEEVFGAAKAGDPQAQEALLDAINYMAVGAVNAWRLFSPDLLILAGGVASAGAQLLTPLRERLRALAPLEPEIAAATELSELDNRAGVLGAAAVALEKLGGRPPGPFRARPA